MSITMVFQFILMHKIVGTIIYEWDGGILEWCTGSNSLCHINKTPNSMPHILVVQQRYGVAH